MSAPSRRKFLAGGALLGTAGAALGAGGLLDTPTATAAVGHGQGHGGGINGATFAAGATVDHKANGFNPTQVLRDFDYGRVSVSSDGRTMREWDVFATDKDIEVAPGVTFPAWTFNGRVPGPTLRCRRG
ncbi:MAG: hypothetical protein WKF83_08660 [Nocardioidaceae bacterium]